MTEHWVDGSVNHGVRRAAQMATLEAEARERARDRVKDLLRACANGDMDQVRVEADALANAAAYGLALAKLYEWDKANKQ